MNNHCARTLMQGILAVFVSIVLAATASAQVEGGGAIVAIDEGAASGGIAKSFNKNSSRRTSSRSRSAKTSNNKNVSANRPIKKWDGLVVGDKYTFLNFEVVSAAKPYHTREAKAGGASGLVQVEVLIDTNGSVLTAKARTGNKLLHAEAERAALESKFNRPMIYGKSARAVGFLVYRFGPADDD